MSDANATGIWRDFRWATDVETVLLNADIPNRMIPVCANGWLELHFNRDKMPAFQASHEDGIEKPMPTYEIVGFHDITTKKWVLPEGEWWGFDPYLLAASACDWIESQEAA